jgi:hypothetical protein
MKSLYAYFGLLRPHTIDSPGHSLYQLGLIDSIREFYNEEKFDFYSYYPSQVIESSQIYDYPDSKLGQVFAKYRDEMIASAPRPLSEVIEEIKKKEYSRLYLKARFRNLSTLSKKWKDARDFEEIINTAISAGYSKEEIIILDTDLSLPESFSYEFKQDVTVLIPSIDFPGISARFLNDCIDAHLGNFDKKLLNCVFYGNIDTSNYKKGNDKGRILNSVLEWCDSEYSSSGLSKFIVICKENEEFELSSNNYRIARKNRPEIWSALEESTIMLNVTKDKYNDLQFIPARIYEAMIFGMIPVSYKFNFLCPAFSFNDLSDLSEILKYLKECSPEDLEKAYLHFTKSYINHAKNVSSRII